MSNDELADIIRRLCAIEEIDGINFSCHDGDIHVLVNCSDTFWWGTADNEELTPQNIGEFEKACADLREQCPPGIDGGWVYGDMLFCCRQRKMRPQNCIVKKLTSAKLTELLNACGPERTDAECG